MTPKTALIIYVHTRVCLKKKTHAKQIIFLLKALIIIFHNEL